MGKQIYKIIRLSPSFSFNSKHAHPCFATPSQPNRLKQAFLNTQVTQGYLLLSIGVKQKEKALNGCEMLTYVNMEVRN